MLQRNRDFVRAVAREEANEVVDSYLDACLKSRLVHIEDDVSSLDERTDDLATNLEAFRLAGLATAEAAAIQNQLILFLYERIRALEAGQTVRVTTANGEEDVTVANLAERYHNQRESIHDLYRQLDEARGVASPARPISEVLAGRRARTRITD